MAMNNTWQDLYRAALLEVRPEELRQRIEAAEKAIQGRLLELGQDDSSSRDELHALADALRGLRVLTNTECRTLPPRLRDLTQSEVAS
jgi:signal transduction histidine kinase